VRLKRHEAILFGSDFFVSKPWLQTCLTHFTAMVLIQVVDHTEECQLVLIQVVGHTEESQLWSQR